MKLFCMINDGRYLSYHTTALILHTSKVMLKILQARLQQYMNRELLDVQAEFIPSEEPEIKLPASTGSSKKQESSRKTSTTALLTMPKPVTVWITTNWNILNDMGIPALITCLLRNLYVGQEATVKTGLLTMGWFKIGKGVRQGCVLSPYLFNLYAEYIMRNSGLDDSQAGIKIAGRKTRHLGSADDITLMRESTE